jgi:hypothetical protein
MLNEEKHLTNRSKIQYADFARGIFPNLEMTESKVNLFN